MVVADSYNHTGCKKAGERSFAADPWGLLCPPEELSPLAWRLSGSWLQRV